MRFLVSDLHKFAARVFLAVFSLAFLFSANTQAQTQTTQQQIEHQLIRRLVVFPMKASPELQAAAEETWWQTREELTKTRRFLVASKQFLMKSDVFQTRGDLEPADAIILGRLLDAHALMTLQLVDRRLIITVYDGGNGFVLWRKGQALHPSLLAQEQLQKIAQRLVNDFIASIIYQGFTLVDPLVGQAVYEDGGVKLAQVDLGLLTGAQIGDLVTWVRVTSATMQPLFQGGAGVTAFAEGKIVRLQAGIATVELTRATSLKELKEYSLVRIPREAERLQSEFTLSDSPRTTLTTELVSPEASPMQAVTKERRPLITALSIISSVAAYLLLAF